MAKPDVSFNSGTGFQQLPTLSYKYNNELPEHARYITSSIIVCWSPPSSFTAIQRVQLRVSNNGFDFTSEFLEFEITGKNLSKVNDLLFSLICSTCLLNS